MSDLFILALVGLTSTGAYLVGRLGLALPNRGLRVAIGKMLECAGVTGVFFVVNIGVALTAILALRLLTGSFVSVYVADDMALPVLSLLQALVFVWWRE
jgi:hypothetical protein